MAAITDTKSLFVSLIRKFGCDLVLDIGSKDGKQSLLFKDVLPQARVVAFEANPLNYRKMTGDSSLKGRITMLPLAVSGTDGKATFHIAEAEYDRPETGENNFGKSTLLLDPNLKVSQSVEVQTVRLDTILQLPEYQSCQSIALWIDVEGAECLVFDGMRAVADRVKIIHVETDKTPSRIGQNAYSKVSEVLATLDLVEIGSNMGGRSWGDVVFVQKGLLPQVRAARAKALINGTIKINQLAGFLKNRCPWLYRALRKLFVKAI